MIGEPAVGVLIQALHDTDENVRWAAAVGIAQVSEPAVPVVIAALRGSAEDIRMACYRELRKIQHRHVIARLPLPLVEEMQQSNTFQAAEAW